jgi:hypothetical protein
LEPGEKFPDVLLFFVLFTLANPWTPCHKKIK